MSEKEKTPLLDGFFTMSETPQLIASKCKTCGTAYFPYISTCCNPDCDNKSNVERILLSPRGKLWSYLVHIYQPPEPFPQRPKEEWQPTGMGAVELPEGIWVLGMITTPENLQIGMEVELTTGKISEDEEHEYHTWMFRPVEQAR